MTLFGTFLCGIIGPPKRKEKKVSTQKKSFILYTDFYNQFELLNFKQRGELISAIFVYVKEGTVLPLTGMTKMAFSSMKDTLDRDDVSYALRCKKNRENGALGGRPKKTEKNPKTEWFFNETQKPDNDIDNDNGIGIDIDIGSGSDNDNEKRQAAAAACATTPTTLSREKEPLSREALISEGVPERYVDEVYERTKYFSSKVGVSIYELIREWWQSDSSNPKWSVGKAAKSERVSKAVKPEKSKPKEDKPMEEWTADDWAEAILEKSFAEWKGGSG